MSNITNLDSKLTPVTSPEDLNTTAQRVDAAKVWENETVGADPKKNLPDQAKAQKTATEIGKKYIDDAARSAAEQSERIENATADLRRTWGQTSQDIRESVHGSLLKTSDFLRSSFDNVCGMLEQPAALGRSAKTTVQEGLHAPKDQRPLTFLGYYSRNLTATGAVVGLVGTAALLSMATVTYVSIPGLLLSLGVVCACDLALSVAYRAYAHKHDPLATPLTTAPLREGTSLTPDEQVTRVNAILSDLRPDALHKVHEALAACIAEHDNEARIVRGEEQSGPNFPKDEPDVDPTANTSGAPVSVYVSTEAMKADAERGALKQMAVDADLLKQGSDVSYATSPRFASDIDAPSIQEGSSAKLAASLDNTKNTTESWVETQSI